MSKKFKVSEADQLQTHLEKNLEKAAAIAVQAAAIHVVEDIQTHIIPAISPPPVDRGIYRSGFRARPTKDGAEIINTVPHAVFIEYGVRASNVKPGKMMINALASWAKRKGIVAKRGKNADKRARSTAFAIARSMQRKGIFNRGGGESGGGSKTSQKRASGGILRKAIRLVRKGLKGILGKGSTKKRAASGPTAASGGNPSGGLRVLEKGLRGLESHLQREIGAALKKVFG